MRSLQPLCPYSPPVLQRHATTAQAIDVAQRMGAYSLILTHFSQRFPKLPLPEPAAASPSSSSSSSSMAAKEGGNGGQGGRGKTVPELVCAPQHDSPTVAFDLMTVWDSFGCVFLVLLNMCVELMRRFASV